MPTDRTDSAAKQLVDLRLQTVLGTTLDEFVAERRQATPRMSWRRVAIEIYEATGQDVSGQGLSNWFTPELAEQTGASS